MFAFDPAPIGLTGKVLKLLAKSVGLSMFQDSQ